MTSPCPECAHPTEPRRTVRRLDRVTHFYACLACDCAERALTREREAGREPDARLWNAVHVSRRFAHGQATQEELYVAARDAVATVSTVSTASAASAAYYAAHAERHWQVEHLISMIQEDAA